MAACFRGDAAAMSLGKTEKGRAALLERPADMNLLERRALILCDGKRDRESLVAMLGADVVPGLDRLLRDGYLVDANAAPARPVLAAVAPMAGIAARSEPLRPALAAVPATPAPPRPAAPASRRSLAASKMYLIDMLQLQRDPESASLRAELQTSPSEDELVFRMVKAVRHLHAIANASYAQRVHDRLAEILPEMHLWRLEQMRVERARSLQPVPSAVA